MSTRCPRAPFETLLSPGVPTPHRQAPVFCSRPHWLGRRLGAPDGCTSLSGPQLTLSEAEGPSRARCPVARCPLSSWGSFSLSRGLQDHLPGELGPTGVATEPGVWPRLRSRGLGLRGTWTSLGWGPTGSHAPGLQPLPLGGRARGCQGCRACHSCCACPHSAAADPARSACTREGGGCLGATVLQQRMGGSAPAPQHHRAPAPPGGPQRGGSGDPRKQGAAGRAGCTGDVPGWLAAGAAPVLGGLMWGGQPRRHSRPSHQRTAAGGHWAGAPQMLPSGDTEVGSGAVSAGVTLMGGGTATSRE